MTNTHYFIARHSGLDPESFQLFTAFSFANNVHARTFCLAGIAVGFAVAAAYGVVLHGAHAIRFRVRFAALFIAGSTA